MELEEFIKQSLVQIVNGISEAQAEVQEKNAWINPSGLTLKPEQIKGHSFTNDGNVTQNIEFDVAVTSTEGSGTKGGIGVVAGILSLGAQGQSSESTQAISRIKFTIPVLLPASHRPDKEDAERNRSKNLDAMLQGVRRGE